MHTWCLSFDTLYLEGSLRSVWNRYFVNDEKYTRIYVPSKKTIPLCQYNIDST